MPFIPHTEEDIRSMLAVIGVDTIESLFDEIPEKLKIDELSGVPEAASEMEISRLMHERATRDGLQQCFIGAGAYEHHIPAAVWQIATRGEYYSAYTPYQAEASQGTLQLIYEYQTMMAGLTAMDVSNASLYDGASALAEAALMAVRANRKIKSGRILVPETVHLVYRACTTTIVKNQNIELVNLPYCPERGITLPETLQQYADEEVAAVVIQQPNFFGGLEEVDQITDWAHAKGALVIAVNNPLSLSLLKPPGHWGSHGADIACGDGQPLGVPLAGGGPYYGFLCCKQEYVRQMPGRIVGRTVDLNGDPGFVLTLQAREQHIRRSKATSNICTNQGLVVTASTIYMAIMGPEGLRRVALQSHSAARELVTRLARIPGVRQAFSGSFFHECVIQFERPVAEVLQRLAAKNILGGFSLADTYPELENALLLCVTETKTPADIDHYCEALTSILSD